MNTRFKVLFASYNILQYLCDFIHHVLIFVTVSKCPKCPKLTNIVIQGIKVSNFMGLSHTQIEFELKPASLVCGNKVDEFELLHVPN